MSHKKLTRTLNLLLIAVLILPVCGCVFFRKPGNLGSYAVCQVTGDSSACLSGLDIAKQAEKTGYWDLTLNFPDVVDGVGTLITLSDAYGMRRVGNINQCLPALKQSVKLVPVPRHGNWHDYNGFFLHPEDFVRLEKIDRLGPKFSTLRLVKVQVDEAEISDEQLDELQFLTLLQNNLSDFSAVCRALLTDTRDVYVVTGALVVQHLTYTFYSAVNTQQKLLINKDNVSDYFVPNPNAEYISAAAGSWTRITPTYVAVRKAEPIRSLGANVKSGTADTRMQEVLMNFCGALKACQAF